MNFFSVFIVSFLLCVQTAVAQRTSTYSLSEALRREVASDPNLGSTADEHDQEISQKAQNKEYEGGVDEDDLVVHRSVMRPRRGLDEAKFQEEIIAEHFNGVPSKSERNPAQRNTQ